MATDYAICGGCGDSQQDLAIIDTVLQFHEHAAEQNLEPTWSLRLQYLHIVQVRKRNNNKKRTLLEQPSPNPRDQEGEKMRAIVDRTRPCRFIYIGYLR